MYICMLDLGLLFIYSFIYLLVLLLISHFFKIGYINYKTKGFLCDISIH
jgi:hypothetical protein